MAPEPNPALARLRNGDVQWDGTLVGVLPRVAGDAALELLDVAPDWERMVDALQDEQRFVAVHVLLTLQAGLVHHGPAWNGLELGLAADGSVQIEPTQRFELRRRWLAWLATHPRPPALPA